MAVNDLNKNIEASPLNDDDSMPIEAEEELEDVIKEVKPNNRVKEIELPKDIKKPSLFSGYQKKNRTVLIYNNIGNPTAILYDYRAGILKKKYEIDLSGYEMENGLIKNISGFGDQIKALIPSIKGLDVVLSLDSIFKDIVSLPKISEGKAMKLYDKEMKNSFGSRKGEYLQLKYEYSHKLGHVFNTYFIDMDIINYFKKLAKSLNTKLYKIDLLGSYIYDLVEGIKDDYSLILIHNKLGTILNKTKGSLITFHSFYVNDSSDIISNYLVHISKHEMEYAKAPITNLIYISDNDYDITTLKNKLNIIDYKLDTMYYRLKGKSL